MSERAVSQIVGMILAALITITLAGISFVWVTGYFQKSTATADLSTEQTAKWGQWPRIQSIVKDPNTSQVYIYVINTGPTDIPSNNLTIFVNGRPMPNITHDPISSNGPPVFINTTYMCIENFTATVLITAPASGYSFQSTIDC